MNVPQLSMSVDACHTFSTSLRVQSLYRRLCRMGPSMWANGKVIWGMALASRQELLWEGRVRESEARYIRHVGFWRGSKPEIRLDAKTCEHLSWLISSLNLNLSSSLRTAFFVIFDSDFAIVIVFFFVLQIDVTDQESVVSFCQL